MCRCSTCRNRCAPHKNKLMVTKTLISVSVVSFLFSSFCLSYLVFWYWIFKETYSVCWNWYRLPFVFGVKLAAVRSWARASASHSDATSCLYCLVSDDYCCVCLIDLFSANVSSRTNISRVPVAYMRFSLLCGVHKSFEISVESIISPAILIILFFLFL